MPRCEVSTPKRRRIILMNESVQSRILNALLDKYERSSFFKAQVQPTRRVMLNFYNGGKSDFPYYDIEHSDNRVSVNRAVIDLAKKELLYFSWMKGESEHIIDKVWLNTDNLTKAYQAVARKPKKDTIDEICREIAITKANIQSSWASNFLQDMYDTMKSKHGLISAIPADDRERSLLLQAISAIDKLDGAEYTERVFSLRTFGDTKVFEQYVKSRILSILRKYLDIDDDAIDEDILKQIGLVKYPEQFELCGNISIIFDSGSVDFSFLPSGGAIFSSDLFAGRLMIDVAVKSVITIENRANYIEYIRKIKTPAELAIYHGGQYSPRKRLFLQALKEALPESCKWYHWGDIDYGGFIMLSRLRREIMPQIIPYRMDSLELERYMAFSSAIKRPYINRLKNLKTRPELSDCYDCIDYMIKNTIRLEQEAMLTDS